MSARELRERIRIFLDTPVDLWDDTQEAKDDRHATAIRLLCEVARETQQSEDSESLRRENQALSEQLDAALRDYRELQSRMKQALCASCGGNDQVTPSKGADTKQIGDELHDILAASLLECNCDDSGKCTACRIDDLAHRLSPFAEGGTVQALQSEGPTPHELRQRIAEISRGGDIEFGPPTDYDYALADAVLKALGHTQQALCASCGGNDQVTPEGAKRLLAERAKVKALAEQYRCTTSAGEDDHLRAELACEIIEILGGRTEQAFGT